MLLLPTCLNVFMLSTKINKDTRSIRLQVITATSTHLYIATVFDMKSRVVSCTDISVKGKRA